MFGEKAFSPEAIRLVSVKTVDEDEIGLPYGLVDIRQRAGRGKIRFAHLNTPAKHKIRIEIVFMLDRHLDVGIGVEVYGIILTAHFKSSP